MTYIQFYNLSTGITWKNNNIVQCDKFPIEAVGSDGVTVVDGRLSIFTICNIATDKIKKSDYLLPIYDVRQGRNFTQSHIIYRIGNK